MNQEPQQGSEFADRLILRFAFRLKSSLRKWVAEFPQMLKNFVHQQQ